MSTFRIAASLVALSLLGLLAGGASKAAETAGLRAGAAVSNITPAIGGDIIGGFSPAPSKHIHDDLHARCLVLDDGKTKLALVVCDLLGVHKIVSDEARRIITERLGIPASHVLISGTHTHSASSALGTDRLKADPKLDEYQTFVARRIADGVTRAANSLRDAELAFGTVDAPEHVFNRRWFMRPGTVPENPFGGSDLVKMNPGHGPNLTEPAGPVDPTVSFLAVREPGGKPIGLFAAYSLHYVGGVGNGHISADYFAVFSEKLKQLMTPERQDPPFVAMMANGTSGDINNNDYKNPPRPRKEPYEQMRFVADDVAQKVYGALKDLKYRRDLTLDARYAEPLIGWRVPTSEELAWAKKKLAEPEDKSGKANLPRIYAERTLKMAGYPAEMPLPVQALRIGDVCIGTLPCEVFCEIGLEFKSRSPLKQAFMVSLNHGYYGYLPTPRHRDLGGYETWLGTNRVEKQASVKLLNAVLGLAEEMVKNEK